MNLTNTAIKNKAKPGAKTFKMFDGEGLFLEVRPNGKRHWRLKYRIDGREKLFAIGPYPEIGLADARKAKQSARTLVAQGIDPVAHRRSATQQREQQKADETINTLEAVARDWFAVKSGDWAENHAGRQLRRLEVHIFPYLGGTTMRDIRPVDLLKCLQRIADGGAVETAHRVKYLCGQIWRAGVVQEKCERDITTDLRDALPSVDGGNHAAVTDPLRLGEILRAVDDYHGTASVVAALKLAPLLFVRPGELRHMRWADVHFDKAQWVFKSSKARGDRKTSTEPDHIVPLANQAIQILQEMQRLTGHGMYVFPSARTPKGDRPMSDNAVLSALRRLGIARDEMSGHGFRATARTIMDEVLGIRVDLIEHQLAHAVKDPNGRAYNRTTFLPERTEMMQQWADYCERLKSGADVVELSAHRKN